MNLSSASPNKNNFEFTSEYIFEDDINKFVVNKRDSDNDLFMYSLESLTADDIAPPPPQQKFSIQDFLLKSIRSILYFISITIFVISLISIINSLYNYKRGDDIYASLADDFFSDDLFDTGEGPVLRLQKSKKAIESLTYLQSLNNEQINSEENTTSGQNNGYNIEFEKIKAKLNNFKEKNNDLAGWITIENTNINYPIVQYTDNDYYLNHAFTGEYLPAGSIFIDSKCNKNIIKNYNTVIYGHNMTNGLMFNHVTKYLDESFFNDNPYIKISTPDGIYTYIVFSIYQTDMYYSYITTDFYTRESFVEFAYEMKNNSLYQRDDIEFTINDRIITLSTCTNGYFTNRYCLQAKLVEVIN